MGGIPATSGILSPVASKHGVIGLTRTAAIEYAAKGIGVIPYARVRSTPRLPPTPLPVKEKRPTYCPTRRRSAAAVLKLCSSWASYVVGHALVWSLAGSLCLEEKSCTARVNAMRFQAVCAFNASSGTCNASSLPNASRR
jgi:hypothetical protein